MNIHVVQPGDTLSSIAINYGVSEAKLLQDNELINPDNVCPPGTLIPGQTIVIVYPVQTYEVQPGDTLDGIANIYNK